MNFFDSHAHLSSPEMLSFIDDVMEQARKNGLKNILNICVDLESFEKGLELESRFPEIKNAAATTPHDAKEKDLAFSVFKKAALEKKIVAIGETGLDYYYKELDPKVQQKFLVAYLHLAIECDLPIIFHCREAFCDLFQIVDLEYPNDKKAVLHCFTGNLLEAEEVLSRGWYLSLSGIITFKKSETLREVAKMAPLKQLLIETDSPYLAPQTRRGKKNEPAFMIETAECIANAKGISLEKVAEATFENASLLFLKN